MRFELTAFLRTLLRVPISLSESVKMAVTCLHAMFLCSFQFHCKRTDGPDSTPQQLVPVPVNASSSRTV